MKLIPAMVAIVVIALAAPLPAADDASKKASPVQPKVHKGDGWAIAAPGNWDSFKPTPATVPLYLMGDARLGVPFFDGTLSPIKAGLQIEVLPGAALTAKEHVAKDLKELKESGNFVPLSDPQVKELTLADGSAALSYDAEFVRLQNGRVSFNTKVYTTDPKGRRVIATGFITCSRPGRNSVKAIALPEFVRAHVLSLVLDPAKADATSTREAYENCNWNAGAGIARTDAGNDLLEKEQYAPAATAFRDAIKLFDHLPAAHNGLAWSLLHNQPGPDELKQAVREARLAVEQTEELDYSALDTLALAYHRTGDKEQALKTIKQALKLQPNNRDLQARLKSFE